MAIRDRALHVTSHLLGALGPLPESAYPHAPRRRHGAPLRRTDRPGARPVRPADAGRRSLAGRETSHEAALRLLQDVLWRYRALRRGIRTAVRDRLLRGEPHPVRL